MDSPKSDFLPSFEYFWNSFGAQQSNLMMIVCGSATAWMTENFADNPGGLFNRHAMRLYLRPFTLCETEEDSVWFTDADGSAGRGAQIDMVIDRRDRVINLCEIKFSINPYTIDRDYEMLLRNN